jgi:hypothetical protein
MFDEVVTNTSGSSWLQTFLTGLPALAISITSLVFAIISWRRANRPLITARVSALGMAGNVSIFLTLIVENTGNRPAKNIRLVADDEELDRHLIAPENDVLREEIKHCFSDEAIIPVLANGKSVRNAFGFTSNQDGATWRAHARFEVRLKYEDLDGRKYEHTIPMLISDNDTFGGGEWVDNDKSTGLVT